MVLKFSEYINEKKEQKETNVSDIKKALGISNKLTDEFKSGSSLAKALLKKTESQVKTSALLIYALDNSDGIEKKMLGDALTYLKDEVPNKE